MTASPQSLVGLIVSGIGRGWLYSPTMFNNVLDFHLDNRDFRIVVTDRTNVVSEVIEAFEVNGPEETVSHLTATEVAQIQRAQDLAAAAHHQQLPEAEPLGYTSAATHEKDERFGAAQAAEFELGGEE